MHFQRPAYLLSTRPHAAELRRLAATAAYASFRARLSRLAKGRLSRSSEENAKKYDELAGTYSTKEAEDEPFLGVYRGNLTTTTGRAIREDVCDRLADVLRGVSAKSVLEVGCGDGNNMPVLSARLPDVSFHGSDISPKRVAFAEKAHGGPRTTWSVASATALPFPDASFDVVFSMHCLEHLPAEYTKALDEFLRVARTHVVLVEPVHEMRGPLQSAYAYAVDYLRGLPAYIDAKGLRVERAELLGSASNPFNLSTLLCIAVPPRG